MSGNDDRDLPGTDGQDAAVTRAWRQASDERPPPRVDDAILAAARDSVREPGADVKAIHAAPGPRHKWMQWQPLLAAASVAGLAFVLVQMLPRDRDVAPRMRVEEQVPAAAARQEGPRSPDAREAMDVTVASPAGPAAEQAPVASSEVAEGALTPVPEPATARDSLAKKSAEESAHPFTSDDATESREADAGLRQEAVPQMAAPAAAATAAAPPASRSLGNVAPMSAADRAARIAELYASGDEAAAAEALRAFRAIDPDADTYLPESVRNWARTVE